MFLQSLLADFACPSDEECTGELKSALIAAFETAIDQGLAPHLAIATVLEWVSEECARLHAGVTSS
jgi:hypothetical protein